MCRSCVVPGRPRDGAVTRPGFEPGLAVPKTAVLPLHHRAMSVRVSAWQILAGDPVGAGPDHLRGPSPPGRRIRVSERAAAAHNRPTRTHGGPDLERDRLVPRRPTSAGRATHDRASAGLPGVRHGRLHLARKFRFPPRRVNRPRHPRSLHHRSLHPRLPRCRRLPRHPRSHPAPRAAPPR